METTPSTNAPTTSTPTPGKTKFCPLGCKSKTFKIIAGLIGTLLAAIFIFAAGVGVGLHKAKYSFQWGQNYERNFLDGRQGMMGGNYSGGMMGSRGFFGGMMERFEGRDFRNAHGISGTIISIADNNLVVKDKDGKENTVTVSDQTLIKSGRTDIHLGDLKQNDIIVVVGTPGYNGSINAELIRVFSNNQ